jgi:hypothetical protein
MSAAATLPADVRAYAHLPAEVPDGLLSEHLAVAVRDLARDAGRTAPATDAEAAWREATIVRALASAFPWLNTFALSGAAKVGRMEGAVEFRFLGPEDVAARVEELTARYDELVAELSEPSAAGAGGAQLDAFWLGAV